MYLVVVGFNKLKVKERTQTSTQEFSLPLSLVSKYMANESSLS